MTCYHDAARVYDLAGSGVRLSGARVHDVCVPAGGGVLALDAHTTVQLDAWSVDVRPPATGDPLPPACAAALAVLQGAPDPLYAVIDAVVRAYLAHRLVQRTSLGRASAAGRAFDEVPDVYDGGDFYLRYDPAHDQLEAGTFVATPADLARLQHAGVFADRLVAALGTGAPVAGDRATPTRLGPAFSRPAPFAGGAAPLTTALVLQPPPGRADAPPLLYLTQRYAVAGLTPRALYLALEPLLDYGTVWRHRWLWRAARMMLGTERPPSEPLVRTPDDYGLDPARDRLDAAPAAPRTSP